MRKVYFVLTVFVVLVFLVSCVVTVPDPPRTREWVLKMNFSYGQINENYYWTSPSFYVFPDTTSVKIVLDCLVAPSYGFEVWIMTPSQLSAFQHSKVVVVTDYWIVYEGNRTLQTNYLQAGNYYVVIDNTDYGWVKTNFDGINDYVFTNMKLYAYEYP